MTDVANATTRGLSTVLHTIVAWLTWSVLGVGLLADQVSSSVSPDASQVILVVTLGIFFPLLLLRIVLAARLFPARRKALLLLLAAVAAWSFGSMAVNATSLEEQAQFPAPGEWLFLLSYVGLAGYLLLDVDRQRSRRSIGWLDIAIICGGTACLASLLLVTPIRIASGQEGLPLLLALIYPMLDVALATVVLFHVLVRARTDLRKTTMLAVAFVLLAAADSGFALQVTAQNYDFSNFSNLLWGTAFALLVAAACRPEQSVIKVIPKTSGTTLLMAAGVMALAVLTVRPDHELAYYMIPPAILTLTAAAARMAMALRDANRATEAFALSQTDDLTLLPNRRAVRAKLKSGIATRQPMALMMLDLDGFKEINDALGHQAGDIVLQFVAVRMREAVGPEVLVARLGGDEFAIVLDSGDQLELLETAQHVLAELAKPLLIDGIEISPSGSIGVAVAMDTDQLDSDILRRADVAMYQAKGSRTGAALYDAHLDDFSRSRLQLAEELRKGIAADQIEVWYQPQVDAATGQVNALEALVRWRHPNEGLLSPVAFLPAARRAGLMGVLSEAIARLAVRDLRQMLDSGLDLRVAINCAPPELLSHTFIPRLYSSLAESGVPAERIVLEVTEDSFLADPQRARAILLDLRTHGLQVSIDDYGTGFSSLTYLRDLPVQELKIDRSLIQGIATDDRSRKIVASTIQLAHALDMRTVAEGVEHAHDVAELVAMGIDVLQGYHIARPMPASEVSQWVREWTTTAELVHADEATPNPPEREPSRASAHGRTSRILAARRTNGTRGTDDHKLARG